MLEAFIRIRDRLTALKKVRSPSFRVDVVLRAQRSGRC